MKVEEEQEFYVTTPEYYSTMVGYLQEKGQMVATDDELTCIKKHIDWHKRNGNFEHTQAPPVFLDDIVGKDGGLVRPFSAVCAIMALFALRLGEALQVDFMRDIQIVDGGVFELDLNGTSSFSTALQT